MTYVVFDILGLEKYMFSRWVMWAEHAGVVVLAYYEIEEVVSKIFIFAPLNL